MMMKIMLINLLMCISEAMSTVEAGEGEAEEEDGEDGDLEKMRAATIVATLDTGQMRKGKQLFYRHQNLPPKDK